LADLFLFYRKAIMKTVFSKRQHYESRMHVTISYTEPFTSLSHLENVSSAVEYDITRGQTHLKRWTRWGSSPV